VSGGVAEAPLRDGEPTAPGWFAVALAEAAWREMAGWGRYAKFESDAAPFADFGFNVHVLMPGEPSGNYHGEDAQETFLVLSGECLLLVEGEERTLRQWDVFHAPAWTRHIFVGAGDGPCAILMVGARNETGDVIYERDPVAVKHGAVSPVETTDAAVAYRGRPELEPVPFDPSWLR
jgi:uncharacterized cupin superfamily protein